jgi:hypothetical protein
MGYYYDWLDCRWLPLDHHEPGPRQRRLRSRRKHLLRELITEINEGGDGVARLYAALLARTLVADQELMQEYGERIVELSSESVASKDGHGAA